MRFSELAEVMEKLEEITGRIEMTNILVKLFLETPPEIIDKVIYLLQGKLAPEYKGIELGVAEKMLIRSLSLSSGIPAKRLEELYKKYGDMGDVAYKIISSRRAATLLAFMGKTEEELSVEEVYNTLMKVAKATGPDSQSVKIRLIAGLFNKASPLEAKYLARIILGALRLGVADMTILDALAIAFAKTKDARPIVERAYNLTSDLGEIARIIAEKGVSALKEVRIQVGRPVRPMLAERLPTPEEILRKLGGVCAAEYKYDGERIQAHKKGDHVVLFSRKLEEISGHYPDAIEIVRRHVLAKEAIVEAEGVAVDPDTGEMLPFQELMHRRRKYGVKEAMEKYPVTLFFFDVLYVDGVDMTLKPYPERRAMLEKIIRVGDRARLATQKIVKSVEELEEFFELAISEGCEGLVCKSLSGNAIYQAGVRGFLWIKFKRSYQSKMIEPIDVVIVGAFHGRGRRAGTYGGLLVAVYDKEADMFRTVCKVGSGFKDDDLAKLPKMLEPYRIPHKHPRVDSKMEADVWFVPHFVIEIIGDEITVSPIHTAAMGRIKPGAGLAIRFPRFTGKYREDKGPEDATTVEELVEMYKAQLKKIG